MRVRLHLDSRRRRTLVLAGLALGLSLIGVQASGATSSIHSAQAAAATGSPTPADEPALSAAAADARSVAGDAYYAGAVVDDSANAVDVYLANAPQAIIDQLEALHPGVYLIHNTAPATLSDLLNLQKSLPVDALRAQGIDINRVGPTADGHLIVGVGSGLAAAQSALAPLVSPSILEVIQQAPATQTGYRYNDPHDPNWKGGDFITCIPLDACLDCSSGINVKDSSHTYMLSAAHCFPFDNNVYNGYVEDNGITVYGSATHIGSVSRRDVSTDYNNPGTDTALIPAPTGYDVFKSGWNSSETTAITGESNNEYGQHVCDSGAFDGEACYLDIHALNQKMYICDQSGSNCQWVAPLALAFNPNNSSLVANGQGDSGGPIYYVDSSTGDHTARGMDDAGQSAVTCTSNPPNTLGRVCYHEVWFVQMGTINSRLGVSPIHK